MNSSCAACLQMCISLPASAYCQFYAANLTNSSVKKGFMKGLTLNLPYRDNAPLDLSNVLK